MNPNRSDIPAVQRAEAVLSRHGVLSEAEEVARGESKPAAINAIIRDIRAANLGAAGVA